MLRCMRVILSVKRNDLVGSLNFLCDQPKRILLMNADCKPRSNAAAAFSAARMMKMVMGVMTTFLVFC